MLLWGCGRLGGQLLDSALGEAANILQKAQGSASFSPKSEWLREVLPHKGLFEAVGTSWQGCLCLPTDGQAFYFSEQSRVEGWSPNPASVSRDRASLGQEGSDVCALHSSAAKWRAAARTAISWSVRSPTLPTFRFSLAELMPYLLVSQNPFWHEYKPLPGGKQLSGSEMPRFVLTAPSTQSESGCHSWPLVAWKDTHVQQIAPPFHYWISEPAWLRNAMTCTALSFKQTLSPNPCSSVVDVYFMLIACSYLEAQV